MAKNDNLTDFLTDVADAIRAKKGSSELINPQDFSTEIASIETGGGSGGGSSSTPKWTGHADAEGLRAIGWTDEDIAYYQANGVNWNEEDDEYHKVSDDNKALYGVLTVNNISVHEGRIVYLPKIDTSAMTSMVNMFSSCYSLAAIPHLDTSNVTSMAKMFQSCYSLTCIPHLDTSNVTSMANMFSRCSSLTTVPHLDTSNVTTINSMFSECYSLTSIPPLDTSEVTNMASMFNKCYSLTSIPPLDTANATNMNAVFSSCYSLAAIPHLDTSNATNISGIFAYSYSLAEAKLKNIKLAVQLNYSALLSKESLLYIINNEVATSAITITLEAYAYKRLATDPDVVAALANHPNISLASA